MQGCGAEQKLFDPNIKAAQETETMCRQAPSPFPRSRVLRDHSAPVLALSAVVEKPAPGTVWRAGGLSLLGLEHEIPRTLNRESLAESQKTQNS